MTRKDYKRIARAIHDSLDTLGFIRTDRFLDLLGQELKEDNSNFKKDTFEIACRTGKGI